MATNIQVVLKTDVDNLGNSGEIVRVKPGYARNYLIPRGMAVVATRTNIAQAEHVRRLALAQLDKERKAAEEQAKALDGLKIQIAKEAGDEGKLFGSVTAAEIVEALSRKDIVIDKRKIIMPEEAIKATGDYEIFVKFPAGVRAPLQLRVVTKS
jgi:large subunit ribosomal protein L9